MKRKREQDEERSLLESLGLTARAAPLSGTNPNPNPNQAAPLPGAPRDAPIGVGVWAGVWTSDALALAGGERRDPDGVESESGLGSAALLAELRLLLRREQAEDARLQGAIVDTICADGANTNPNPSQNRQLTIVDTMAAPGLAAEAASGPYTSGQAVNKTGEANT